MADVSKHAFWERYERLKVAEHHKNALIEVRNAFNFRFRCQLKRYSYRNAPRAAYKVLFTDICCLCRNSSSNSRQ